MDEIRFTIFGRPVSKQRPRIGRGIHVYIPKATREYEEMVAGYALVAKSEGRKLVAELYDDFLEVDMDIFVSTRKIPDADNVRKSILDAMQGIIYKDDNRVRGGRTDVWECQKGEERVEVTIRKRLLGRVSDEKGSLGIQISH